MYIKLSPRRDLLESSFQFAYVQLASNLTFDQHIVLHLLPVCYFILRLLRQPYNMLLSLQTSKDFIENLDAMQIRDQINDAFFKEEGETQPTIVMITKSQSNQSIVITTMPNFSAKYLVEKKEVWKNIIPHQKVYTDEK